jgi:hypothetical protein
LLDSTPGIHILYAAFVSAEVASLPKSNDTSPLKYLPIVSYPEVWMPRRFIGGEHESIYKHTVEHYFNPP